jgi:hypothetical protein
MYQVYVARWLQIWKNKAALVEDEQPIKVTQEWRKLSGMNAHSLYVLHQLLLI